MSQSDSDSSISLDSEEFKRLYEKQLKKSHLRHMQQKQIDLDINEQNSRSRQTNQISISKSRERQRSRDGPKQKVSWHIYQQIEQVDYVDTLNQKLRNLPIFNKKKEILQQIISNQVVLVTGDTGCGKSTQVPRLIYQYLKQTNNPAKIICVQPRRLAVTSLKSSVQSQIPRGERVVGYQIGQKAEFSQESRIVFMTNGIFLQRLIHDTKFLEEYPFVVLDEVHERDIDTDFILTALKRVIRNFPKVRIVLMSATIDNQLFRYYFASDHIDKFMTEENFYKQIIELEEEQKARNGENSDEECFITNNEDSDEQQEKKRQIYENVALKFLESRFPCPVININQPSNFKKTYFYLDTLDQFIKKEYARKWGSIIWSHKHAHTHKELFETACLILNQIKENVRSQRLASLEEEAVLVFLPGLNQIQNFSESIFTFLGGREKVYDYFEIIHVHSTIMNERVEERINTPNKRQIKVIISTNIAESSITVKGVKYIIDFCLTKEIRYDEKSRMENLDLVYSSKASCRQRAGRTGRTCDGLVFRLVQKIFYDQKFLNYSEPQIKRSSLDKLILRIKMMHEFDSNNLFRDPPEVLGTCIQPPKLQSIQSSINSLKFCGGLDQKGHEFFITELGKLYVQLPIDIVYTKLLLVSIMFGTFNDILILVSILSQNKSPIHKRQIQNNYLKYFDSFSNYEYCDFLALVNMYKIEEESRKSSQQSRHERLPKREQNDHEILRDRNKIKDRLPFSIYTETKNTIYDIMKRLERKWFNFEDLSDYLEFRDGLNASTLSRKAHDEKVFKNKYQDFYMRFKLTIAFGFIDKLILIKPPLYDAKQQKRIRDMKRLGISNDNTIVLLNSSVITKPPGNNREAEEKFIRHWKNVFFKSLNINLHHITLTSGLNYLHFEDDIDLNKLLYVKYMDSNSKRRLGCVLDRDQSSRRPEDIKRKDQTPSSSLLTTKQVLQCLGDLDHMQEGIPVTLFKQNRVIIDQNSLNRVCNLNQDAGEKYLVTNAFMLQNKSTLTCRYTSMLNLFHLGRNSITNSGLHVICNLLFYPFVKLKADKANTEYEYLVLKKKYSIKIGYDLTSDQIDEANLIRQLTKQFLEFKRPINSQNCSDFYNLVRDFVLRKRRNLAQQKQEQNWQNQFLTELKEGKILQVKPALDSNSKEKAQISQQNQKKSILEEVHQVSSIEINKLNINQLRQLVKHTNKMYETRNFMNPIELPNITAAQSYFLRSVRESADIFKNRIQTYLKWKESKLDENDQLSKYANDNDTYVCCGSIDQSNGQKYCGVPICKLKRVGEMDEDQVFRDLFEPINSNLAQYIAEGSQIDDYLEGQNYQHEYTKICCKNNHELGIKLKGQAKMKIMIFKQFALKLPDGPYSQMKEVDFQSLNMKDWAQEEKLAVSAKEKKPISTSCYYCVYFKQDSIYQYTFYNFIFYFCILDFNYIIFLIRGETSKNSQQHQKSFFKKVTA